MPTIKPIICLAPHAKQTVDRHPLQRQAFDNDAVAGSKNVVSRNKPLQNWMLEFTGKKYLALVKPKVFPMVLVLDGSSEIDAQV